MKKLNPLLTKTDDNLSQWKTIITPIKWQCCPVCNGHGTISRPPNIAGDQQTWPGWGTSLYMCPCCNGHKVINIETGKPPKD